MEVFPAQFLMNTDFPVNGKLLDELRELSKASKIEVCGFIIYKNNDCYYKSCKNLHPDGSNFFVIDPKECVFENSILFHSHPQHVDLDGFSDWDLENQRYFCLPMLLYSVNRDVFYYKSI